MFLEKETIIFWGTLRPLRSIHDILGSIHAAPAAEPEEQQETSADDEGKAAVQKVQALIDALPDVDALSMIPEDELNAAYLAVQEAYDAYDALTAEQQAQIMGADCFEELFGWFNGQVALLATLGFSLTLLP